LIALVARVNPLNWCACAIEPRQRMIEANESERIEPADAPPPAQRRLAFWRAVAGMGLAFALACAIVALEFGAELSHRSQHYRNRISALSSRLKAMRGEVANADRELAEMRTAVVTRDELNRILAAPDVRLIRLIPAEHEHPTGTAGNAPRGLIVTSRRLGRAVFEVAGLTPLAAAQRYTLWWMIEKHGAVQAAQFMTVGDGRATVAAAMPAEKAAIEDCIVTAGPVAGVPGQAGVVTMLTSRGRGAR
jgi:hypothetical protein